MPNLRLNPDNFSRAGLPGMRLVNMIAEAGGPLGVQFRARPALTSVLTVGAGPIRLVVEWFFNYFVISGTQVWCIPFNDPDTPVLVGSVAAGGYVQAAKSDTQLVIVSGFLAYCIESTDIFTMAQITDPDLPAVSSAVYQAGKFVYGQFGTGTYFFSATGDATDIDGLSFASTETSTDAIFRIETLDDEILFFGGGTVERHRPSGNPDAPFLRSPGRVYYQGTVSPQSVIRVDNTVIWIGGEIGADRIVYRAAQVPVRISDHSVEAAIGAFSRADVSQLVNITAFPATVEGHQYYVVRLPGAGAYAHDFSNGRWYSWESYGQTALRLLCGDGNVFGDAVNGALWQLAPEVFEDGSDPLVRVVSAYLATTARIPCETVTLQGAAGVGLPSGQGSDPMVEMRYSDDGGNNWSQWHSASLGVIGDYGARATWRRKGQIKPPGRLFEFRWSDPVLSVVWNVLVNERP